MITRVKGNFLKHCGILDAITSRPGQRFMKGLLRALYERSIYERTFLSELMKNLDNHAISNELSNVNYVKKHFHKRYCVFRCDREPSRIPKRTLERLKSKVKFIPGIYNAQLLMLCQSCKTIIKRQPRFYHVKILTFTAGYA